MIIERLITSRRQAEGKSQEMVAICLPSFWMLCVLCLSSTAVGGSETQRLQRPLLGETTLGRPAEEVSSSDGEEVHFLTSHSSHFEGLHPENQIQHLFVHDRQQPMSQYQHHQRSGILPLQQPKWSETISEYLIATKQRPQSFFRTVERLIRKPTLDKILLISTIFAASFLLTRPLLHIIHIMFTLWLAIKALPLLD